MQRLNRELERENEELKAQVHDVVGSMMENETGKPERAEVETAKKVARAPKQVVGALVWAGCRTPPQPVSRRAPPKTGGSGPSQILVFQ